MSKKGSYSKEAAPKATLDKVTGKQVDDKSVPGDAIPAVGDNPSALEASQVKEAGVPKTVVTTKKVAELVDGGATPQTGVAAPLLRAAGRINYSGSADDIGGDRSAIAEGKAINKSGDRPGRQADTALQHIDDVPAETYVVPIKTIPQLGDVGARVGYNGKYRNAHKVSQKGSGGSPADSDFFRTLDECQYDNIYFGMGQVNATTTAAKQVKFSTWNANKTPHSGWDEITEQFGNFVPRKLVVKFDSSRNLESLNFQVDDISTDNLDEMVYRAAGDALLRETNKYELDRLAMIDKAGDETKPNWSFMGKVTPNARGVASVIGELDKNIGDLLGLAGFKLSHALAYQNNKAAKDGLRKVAPMWEMLEGNVDGTTHRFIDAGFDDDPNYAVNRLFNANNGNLAKGSAAMYICMMDSVTKYNTKGKLLSLPLSFKTAISTFRQNCGEFRMHESFINEFNRQEVFGKIDADATGLSPYFVSDGASLALSLNIFDQYLGKDSVSDPIMIFHYEDIRNKYDVPVWNYFIEGLKTFITRYARKICEYITAEASGTDQGKYIWTIPITSTTTCISMWDVLLCAAAKDIAISRRYAMDAVIQYEAMNGYPYHGSVKLGDMHIGPLANIGFTDITEPLKAMPVPLTTGVKLLMPEVFWCKGYAADHALDGTLGQTANNGVVGSVVLPWYFNQEAFAIQQPNIGKNYVWGINPDGLDSMTFFDFRGGVSLDNADRVFGMDPEQLKLCMDRMVIPPDMSKQIDGLKDVFHPTVLKYAEHEDGIPVFLYYIASKQTDGVNYRLTIQDVLKAPRELGLSMVAPSGYVTPNFDGTDANYRAANSAYFVTSGPSFRIRCWSSTPKSQVGNELFDEVRSGDYAVNLKAHYYSMYAQPDLVATDIGIVLTANTGAGLTILTERHNPEVVVKANTNYIYESGNYESNEECLADAAAEASPAPGDVALANAKTVSIAKYFYTRLNYLPFVINPFDVNTKKFTGSESTTSEKMIACNAFDVYDFLHLFNMCGFRCGEYSAAAVERDRARIELGIGYVEDPYIQRRS